MRSATFIVFAFLAGCGPLNAPMVQRLSEEEQQQIEDSWRNMLTPPDRLDRTLLLDTVITYQLHQLGVDFLRMTSEKQVEGGLVVMEVRYDRSDPAFDEFEIALVDSEGYEIRRERYTHEEVRERFEYVHGPIVRWCSEDEEEPSEEEIQRLAAEHEARMLEIYAATQPAIQE
jgi:hypothetical protein